MEWQPEPGLTNGTAPTSDFSLEELVAQAALENGISVELVFVDPYI